MNNRQGVITLASSKRPEPILQSIGASTNKLISEKGDEETMSPEPNLRKEINSVLEGSRRVESSTFRKRNLLEPPKKDLTHKKHQVISTRLLQNIDSHRIPSSQQSTIKKSD